MEKLFLLKPDFQDINRDPEKKYFCPECAPLEGLLSWYPRLRDEIEVQYVDYRRPRKVLADLLGEENQGCPVLVLEDGTFINELNDIYAYLTEHHRIGHRH